MTSDPVKSICPYCGVGCGITASVASDSEDKNKQSILSVSIQGDQEHPSNQGRLCSKGADLAQTFHAPHRLLTPQILGEEASWSAATALIAERFQQTIDEFGWESVAFYVSGQLLTEDYYVVNKLTKGWFGTANIDTNSRLCMASSVVGHKRAFGSDTVPGCYEDLEQADVLVLVGSNLAWCHPVLYQRVRAAREKRPNMKLVVIDPRRSATADEADLHLAIRPDADTLLFNALLIHLVETDQVDKTYVDQHVNGFDASVSQARSSVNSATELENSSLHEQLGIDAAQMQQFFSLVENCKKTVTVYSQGVNQSVSGTDKVNAIINCHLATGRIGKPGMGPFSITGQPNAMGGREVGGLATMLACHMDLNNAKHRCTVQRFWQSPTIADHVGLTAVELFDAVASGSVKALWIMATNPVDSMPDADSVKEAISNCPFVVVSDVSSSSDTVELAHVALPAQPFGEKNGTVTNSERRISRMRRFVAIQGQARPDWWAICEVARRMGYTDAFDFKSVSDIFREYARLSGFENNGSRDFDISACAELSDADYDNMAPFQWPKPAVALNDAETDSADNYSRPIRFFANGHFYTPDKKANMLPVVSAPLPDMSDGSVAAEQNLNTGRIRDQWHTMTRTGYSSRLMSHMAEPFVQLHPQLAQRHAIETGDVVRVSSYRGQVLLRASVSDRQPPSQVFVPMHWTGQFASCARIDSVVDSRLDPHSRQPAFKNQSVSITRFVANSYAFVVSSNEVDMEGCQGIEYWAKAPVDGGWQIELAGSASVERMLMSISKRLLVDQAPGDENCRRLDYNDKHKRTHRSAWVMRDRLQCVAFVGNRPVEVSRNWTASQLSSADISPPLLWQLLAGRPAADIPDKGAIVCSCMMVGDKEIQAAIVDKSCCTVNKVGSQTGAGTQCGSCRNDIGQIIKRLESEQRDAQVA
ncbi:MAG: molybdopterin-dependent oxidoreductase [Granulosicoccus sp.]|nr:molybdopterin-dependent oxidoreductase [Granulosicoccus sp.]